MYKVRFAPSPSGKLHAGNALIALHNWHFIKKVSGEFILRIDDTQEKCSEKILRSIYDDLDWLNIKIHKTYFQSERKSIYEQAFEYLKNINAIYPCDESNEELQKTRQKQMEQNLPPVYKQQKKESLSQNIHWRFKLPNQTLTWNEEKKNFAISLENLSDPIIKKSDGNFSYIFTSVIDDMDLKITHVIRGEDHITNTAVQTAILEKFNYSIKWQHIPLLCDEEKNNLSKRNNSQSLESIRNSGIHTQALENYLMQHTTGRKIFAEKELQILNHDTLRQLSYEKVSAYTKRYMPHIEIQSKFWKLIKENLYTFNEIIEWQKICTEKIKTTKLSLSLPEFPPTLNEKNLCIWLNELVKINKTNKKTLYPQIRIALTGKKNGPNLVQLFQLIPCSIIIQRIGK